jgi:hypothetical protein
MERQMRLLVEPTGPFMLIDSYTGDIVDSEGASVVRQSQFIQARVAAGQINVLLGGLMDTATTEEWKEYLKGSGGKKDLAIASFESAFKPQSGPDFSVIDQAVQSLLEEDFQKDGKPKVGPLKVLIPEINTELRDAYWEWKSAQ